MARIRRIFLLFAALASGAFVIGQLVVRAPDGALFATTVERLEAQDVLAAQAPKAWITVETTSGPVPRAVLLVDSVPRARFRQSSVTVAVSPGDLIEVDGRAYARRLTFRISAVGPDLREPSPRTEAVTVGDIALLGRVQER